MSLYTDIQQSKTLVSGNRDKGIHAEFNFPGTLELFKGHFPEKPILPGIAQIEMVRCSLETILKTKLAIQSIKKTKFSHLIEPDTPVLIHITLLPQGMDDGDLCQISAKATLSTSGSAAGKINLTLRTADQGHSLTE